MKAKSTIVYAVAAVFLSACGGGGGSSPTVVNADPQGFWQGNSSDGHAVATLVLETGQYFAVYSANNVVDGMIEGTLMVNGNSISDKSAVDFVVGTGVFPGSLTGTVATKQSLSATVSESGRSINFSGTYNATYDATPTISEAVGTWTGTAAGNPETTTLTIAADGTFNGATGTCAFSGSAKPRASGKNVFDANVTFNSASCPEGAGTSIGFEVVISGTQMIAAGVNSARNEGFIFLGTRS
ncbi:hypothetical protein [Paraburkholderia sp. XV]|uniref:hypothetical protein n=1 Tax=Paraburkholderia sp. XV TaxID=2831520 RepID=UPI001CD5587B|nr:hypothetical protein [Paraburkholderia sp. XV]